MFGHRREYHRVRTALGDQQRHLEAAQYVVADLARGEAGPDLRSHRHLGLSEASDTQLTEAQAIAPVVTVQNLYNVASRRDDALVDRCAAEGIAYAAYFPLGGFTPLASAALDSVAARLGASAQQVALAWLQRRSPTMVLIPGTSSVAHLRENVAAAGLFLPPDALAELDTIGRA